MIILGLRVDDYEVLRMRLARIHKHAERFSSALEQKYSTIKKPKKIKPKHSWKRRFR